jgi:hypothetical protein
MQLEHFLQEPGFVDSIKRGVHKSLVLLANLQKTLQQDTNS